MQHHPDDPDAGAPDNSLASWPEGTYDEAVAKLAAYVQQGCTRCGYSTSVTCLGDVEACGDCGATWPPEIARLRTVVQGLLCSCTWADDGDGESGPRPHVVAPDEQCPQHGRAALPDEWAAGDAMERGYVLSTVASLLRLAGQPGQGLPSGSDDLVLAMYQAALAAVPDDDGSHYVAAARVADAMHLLATGQPRP